MIDLDELKRRHNIMDVAARLDLRLVGYGANTKAARCFKHEDKNPSLVLMPEVNRFECKSCGEKGDILDLIRGIKGLDLMEAVAWLDPSAENGKTVKTPQAINPATYLETRKIKPDTATKFGLRVESNRLVIPLPTGEKYRNFYGEPKYEHKAGTKACVFKCSATDKPTKVILVEGELDAILLWQETGYSVWTGTSGAETFKEDWLSEFEGIEKIFIAYDNDAAGEKGAHKAATVLGIDRCVWVQLPKGTVKDWTEYFQLGFSKKDVDELLQNAHSFDSTFSDKLSAAEVMPDLKVYSGFASIDSSVGGFRGGKVYPIAGNEKSGKTFFLMNIAHDLMFKQGLKVAYINTELGIGEFSDRMAALYHNKSISEVEQDRTLRHSWGGQVDGKLFYAGIDDKDETLKDNGRLSFDKTMSKLELFVGRGARVLILDNLTTYMTQATATQQGWQILAKCATKITEFANEKKVVIFYVIHTKSTLVETETLTGLKQIIKDSMPSRIFEESVSIVQKPTLSNVYGGGGVQSQISGGTILIWRPYQKFSLQEWQEQSMIILESFRDGVKQTEIEMKFLPSRARFVEKEVQDET